MGSLNPSIAAAPFSPTIRYLYPDNDMEDEHSYYHLCPWLALPQYLQATTPPTFLWYSVNDLSNSVPIPMPTRIDSPSDRFIGYPTRPTEDLQYRFDQSHHHFGGRRGGGGGGGGGGGYLDETLGQRPQTRFYTTPTPVIQPIALPPHVDIQNQSVFQQPQASTMASGSNSGSNSSPLYIPITPPQPSQTRRTTTTAAWQPQQLNLTGTDFAFSGNNNSNNNETLIAQQLPQAPAANDVNDVNAVNAVNEPYLSALADTDFSSPSSYPSFTNPTPAPRLRNIQYQPLAHAAAVQPPAPGPDSAPYPSTNSTAPRSNNPDAAVAFAGACNVNVNLNRRNFSAPERSETQLTSSTNAALESQNTLFSNDNQEWDELFDTPASSFDENMPVTRSSRRHHVATPPLDTVHPSKRRRTSTTARTPTLRKSTSSRAQPTEIKSLNDDDDIFIDTKETKAASGKDPDVEDLTTIDLTEVNEVPEELKKPEKDNRVKLSAFQCVICMDDATGLTVTHCGHMYCAQCLHSSLHVETTRGGCPMCRQKLDMKPRPQWNAKSKGYWPLELKLMTATKKGKRKANATS